MPFPSLWLNPETALEMGKDHHCNTASSRSTRVVASSPDRDILLANLLFLDLASDSAYGTGNL